MFIKNTNIKRIFDCVVLSIFVFLQVCGIAPQNALAQNPFNLPSPGTMIAPSAGYTPVMVSGITIYPDNPLQFDFIIDTGDDNLQGEELRQESKKLINYFLATLTVPEDEMWVNLSPYEKDRIIANGLGVTEMGRDMLAQDYMLKQLTASLMYPEEEIGETFWKKIYAKAQARFGTTEIPTNTFNKVWIVPEKAVVYINGTSVFVSESRLKVMLEEDYLALEANKDSTKHALGNMTTETIEQLSAEAKEIIREVIIPEIEKEVNEGKNFVNLRQIYNSMILAAWYKKNVRESILGSVYIDSNKTSGIDLEDKNVKEKIYSQYVEAFQKGVYNYIKEDYDEATQEVIPRKYFSGGLKGVEGEDVEAERSELARKRVRDNFADEGVEYVETVRLDVIDGSGNVITPGQAGDAEKDESMLAEVGIETGLSRAIRALISSQIRSDIRVYEERDKEAAIREAISNVVQEVSKTAQMRKVNVPDEDIFNEKLQEALSGRAIGGKVTLFWKSERDKRSNHREGLESDELVVLADLISNSGTIQVQAENENDARVKLDERVMKWIIDGVQRKVHNHRGDEETIKRIAIRIRSALGFTINTEGMSPGYYSAVRFIKEGNLAMLTQEDVTDGSGNVITPEQMGDVNKDESGVNSSPIEKKQIAGILNDVFDQENELTDKPSIRENIISKINGLGLKKGKTVLIVGPGGQDYLPVVLAKLGLKVSTIEISEWARDDQINLQMDFDLDRHIQNYSSYDSIQKNQFDYIFVVGSLNSIITPIQYSQALDVFDLIPEARNNFKRLMTNKINNFLNPILPLLNLNNGRLFVADIDDFFDIIPDFGKIVQQYDGFDINLKVNQGISIDNFSLYPGVFNEKRRGFVFDVVPQSSPRQNHGGIDFNPGILDLEGQGGQINFTIDNSMLQNFQSDSVHGISPVIINITPILNYAPLIGLSVEADVESQQLSKLAKAHRNSN